MPKKAGKKGQSMARTVCDRQPAPNSSARASSVIRLWSVRMVAEWGMESGLLREEGYSHVWLAKTLKLPGVVHSGSPAFDAPSVLRAIRRLRDRLDAARPAPCLPEVLSKNLDAFCELIGLSRLERDLLALLVIMREEQVFQHVCSNSGEHTARRLRATLAAALGTEPDAIAKILRTDAPLIQLGLVKIDNTYDYSLTAKVELALPGFAETAYGSLVQPIDLLGDRLVPAPGTTLQLSDYDHLPDVRSVLLPFLSTVSRERQGATVLLHGVAGVGKTSLTQVLARELNAPLYEVAVESNGTVLSASERCASWVLAQRLLANAGACLLFDEFDEVLGLPAQLCDTPVSKSYLTKKLEAPKAITFFCLNQLDLDEAYLRRIDVVIGMTPLSAPTRARLISAASGGLIDAPVIASMSRCASITPAIVARARGVV